jgi:hypothetical protein
MFDYLLAVFRSVRVLIEHLFRLLVLALID